MREIIGKQSLIVLINKRITSNLLLPSRGVLGERNGGQKVTYCLFPASSRRPWFFFLGNPILFPAARYIPSIPSAAQRDEEEEDRRLDSGSEEAESAQINRIPPAVIGKGGMGGGRPLLSWATRQTIRGKGFPPSLTAAIEGKGRQTKTPPATTLAVDCTRFSGHFSYHISHPLSPALSSLRTAQYQSFSYARKEERGGGGREKANSATRKCVYIVAGRGGEEEGGVSNSIYSRG